MALLYVCPAHLVLVLPGGEAPWEFDLWTWGVVPLPLVLLSPCVAGLAFVTRSFLREEPTFLWSDFWKAVRGNWKCFLGNGLVLYLVGAVLSFSTRYYQARLSQDLFSYLPFWCCVLLGVVFLWAQFYLPLLFVTFDLTFRQAYRNAFLFAALGLPREPAADGCVRWSCPAFAGAALYRADPGCLPGAAGDAGLFLYGLPGELHRLPGDPPVPDTALREEERGALTFSLRRKKKAPGWEGHPGAGCFIRHRPRRLPAGAFSFSCWGPPSGPRGSS